VWAAALLAVSILIGSVLTACAGSPGTDPSGAPSVISADLSTTTLAATPSTSAEPVPFHAVVDRVTAADLPSSWRRGCPVAPEELRLLALPYWGFDDRPHPGSMVVRASVAPAVIEVFQQLYDRRFPIRRMEPIDVFGGSDDASIAADNTSGFNCRNAVAAGAPHWSAHAYGEAIDVNPVENPYLEGGRILPPEGAAFTDRSAVRPGMAVRGSELNAAFAAAGWYWGGGWASPDYQHFSATGG